VLDDQLALKIKNIHPIVIKAARQYFRENAERIVDAQCIRRLAEPDTRHVESRTPLDDDDFDAAPGEGGGSRQAADSASDNEHAANIAHSSTRGLTGCRTIARIEFSAMDAWPT
jgi:hypothetical protein